MLQVLNKCQFKKGKLARLWLIWVDYLKQIHESFTFPPSMSISTLIPHPLNSRSCSFTSHLETIRDVRFPYVSARTLGSEGVPETWVCSGSWWSDTWREHKELEKMPSLEVAAGNQRLTETSCTMKNKPYANQIFNLKWSFIFLISE